MKTDRIGLLPIETPYWVNLSSHHSHLTAGSGSATLKLVTTVILLSFCGSFLWLERFSGARNWLMHNGELETNSLLLTWRTHIGKSNPNSINSKTYYCRRLSSLNSLKRPNWFYRAQLKDSFIKTLIDAIYLRNAPINSRKLWRRQGLFPSQGKKGRNLSRCQHSNKHRTEIFHATYLFSLPARNILELI